MTAGPRPWGEKPIYSPYNELQLREDDREGDASAGQAGLSFPANGAVVSDRAMACVTSSSVTSSKRRLTALSCLCAQIAVTTPPR